MLMGSIMVSGGGDGNILVWDFNKPENLLENHFYYETEIEFLKTQNIFVSNKSQELEHQKNSESTTDTTNQKIEKQCITF